MRTSPRSIALFVAIPAALALSACSSGYGTRDAGGADTLPPPDSPSYDDTALVREPAPMETPEADRREIVEEGIDTLLLGARWQAPARATPYVGSGLVGRLGAGTSDASRLGSIVHAPAGEMERIVIALAEEGGFPAERPGRVRVELLRDLGVVRVQLPAPVVRTAVTESYFAGALARAAFVVRPLRAESLFVDIHLAGARGPEARAYLLEDPALVVVELRPGGTAWEESHRTGRHAVVLQPRPGEIGYPIEIRGYARTFEASVTAELRRDGERLARGHTQAADYVYTWGQFRMTLEDGPRGDLELRVGEYSARDGSWQGVSLPLSIR